VLEGISLKHPFKKISENFLMVYLY
jgi:hypothetical protein